MESQPFSAPHYESLNGSRRSADVIAPLITDLVGKPESIVDFGCGIGAWLAGFAAAGVSDYVGLEGGHPDPGQLLVPAEKIITKDLQEPVDLGRRFDLAISLEVAEHLPAESSATYVASVAHHTDTVLFSAAIPRQGGIHHINEQWPSYWYDLWRAEGFECFDVLRWQVWENSRVASWYRQNILLYARGPVADRLRTAGHRPGPPKSVVHPSLLEHYQVRFEIAMQPRPKRLRQHLREVAGAIRHRRREVPTYPQLEWPL